MFQKQVPLTFASQITLELFYNSYSLVSLALKKADTPYLIGLLGGFKDLIVHVNCSTKFPVHKTLAIIMNRFRLFSPHNISHKSMFIQCEGECEYV